MHIRGAHMQAKGHCCQVPEGWGTYSIAKSRLVEGPLLPGWVVCGTTIAKSWQQDKEPLLLPGPDKALQQISRNNSSVSGKNSRWVFRTSLNCKNMVPVFVWEDTVHQYLCSISSLYNIETVTNPYYFFPDLRQTLGSGHGFLQKTVSKMFKKLK